MADTDRLIEFFRTAFKQGAEMAASMGKTVLPHGTRVRVKFPWPINHETLGTIRGCDEGSALPMLRTFGYLVDIETPIIGSTNRLPFVPHDEMEVL